MADNATQDEIEKAYRKKALQYHPDRNPGDTEVHNKFIAVQEAYDTLKDVGKRKQYDDSLNPNFISSFDFFEHENLDIKVNCEISIFESISGTNKTISLNKKAPCSKCNGFGASDFKKCDVCSGRGNIINTVNEIFRFQTVCGKCMGHGKISLNTCETCLGSKKQFVGEQQIQFNIPKGIQHGMTLCLHGQGNLGKNGRVGNLFVQCLLANNNTFKVDGLNILCTVNAKYSTMLFGGKIEIPTPENDIIEIEVPKNTQCLTKLTVKNKGMFDFRNINYRGDLVATVMTEIPQNIKDEREIKEFLIKHNL